MSYFPMFVELKNTSCLVVGGGRIALRKVKALLDFEAKITVVAEKIIEEITQLKKVSCQKRKFITKDLDGKKLVVVATDDKELNHTIAEACKEKKIPVNTVDTVEDCSFIFPAYLKQKEVVAAFCSGGQSPIITQYLKKQATPLMTEQLGFLADCLGGLRKTVKKLVATEKERKELYEELLSLGLKKKELPSKKEIEELLGKYKTGEDKHGSHEEIENK